MKESLFLLFLVSIAYPVGVWPQDANLFAPGVKVLATLESAVYDWSPDGQRLAYVTDDGIWMVEAPEFRHPKRLIRKGRGGAAHQITQLRWSPDGQKLAFASPRPGDEWSTIWLVDADGSHLRDLFPPGGPLGRPGRGEGISGWLSNAEIAFVDGCGTGCVALKKVNTENAWSYGSLCETMVNNGLVGRERYYWAPTKTRAIAELDAGALGLVEVKNAQEVLEPSFHAPFCRSAIQGCTSGKEQIEGRLLQFDAWSPDGKYALYHGWDCWYDPVSESGVNLHLWDVDAGQQHQLINNAGWAAWSPDGTKIAFLLFGAPRYDKSQLLVGADFVPGQPVRISVGIMAVATREVQTLIPLDSEATTPERVAEWELLRPDWSPDSKQLALHNGKGELFLVEADGKNVRPVTQGLPVKATWSPDGKSLALQPLSSPEEVSASRGLERFLPPVGKEEAALADVEIIKRYFLHVLTETSNADFLGDFLRTYVDFLAIYAQALEQQGKHEVAQGYFCQSLEEVLSSKPWRDRAVEPELEGTTAACKQLLLQQPEDHSGQVLPWKAKEGGSEQNSSMNPRVETSSGSQQLPSLYIIEALEKG
jgi:WD40 repeat protein